MANKMLVTMKMDQRLQMSQQLRQAITLLQYNTLDLKQLVQHYIDSNPLLEIEESDELESTASSEAYTDAADFHLNNYSTTWSSGRKNFTDESALENISLPKSLREHLLEQTLLCHFNETE